MTIKLRETLLLVYFLLLGLVDSLRVAGVPCLHLALGEGHVHAVVDLHRVAVHGALHLTRLLHFYDFSRSLHEVRPLDGGRDLTVGLDRGEVHGLSDDLALLPSHGLAFLLTSPHLVAIGIYVPV